MVVLMVMIIMVKLRCCSPVTKTSIAFAPATNVDVTTIADMVTSRSARVRSTVRSLPDKRIPLSFDYVLEAEPATAAAAAAVGDAAETKEQSGL